MITTRILPVQKRILCFRICVETNHVIHMLTPGRSCCRVLKHHLLLYQQTHNAVGQTSKYHQLIRTDNTYSEGPFYIDASLSFDWLTCSN